MKQMPHCDCAILHAPGECQYCDQHPDWQEYRDLARINFSGHDDADKAPCPATFFRNVAQMNAWFGNRSKTALE